MNSAADDDDVAGLAHGGSDDGPFIVADFSTNAHPCGPNPFVLAAVRDAPVGAYPDPAYRRLRTSLAGLHGVVPQRIVVGASASELIWRVTRLFAGRAAHPDARVVIESPTYGEYRRAALACGLTAVPAASAVGERAGSPALAWLCSPNNPTGELRDAQVERALDGGGPDWPPVVDLAYRPFHALLAPDGGHPGVLRTRWADRVAQLWSPNKLHGLTGVRGAYLVLPARAHAVLDAPSLSALAPSWVLGADGVAMLQAHARPQSLDHLHAIHAHLQAWKAAQDDALIRAGWELRPSRLHFGLARPPWRGESASTQQRWHAHLRLHGIKLRDAASFGLPGCVRLCVRPPKDVALLIELTREFTESA